MMSKHRLAGLWPGAVAAAVGLALSACGGSSAPAADGAGTSSTRSTTATTAPHFRSLDTQGFESGTPSGLTDHERGEVTRAAAKNGSFGFDTDAQQSNAYGRWDAAPDGTRRPWWSFRAWVRIVSWTPGESVDLFTVENLDAESNFDLFISAPSRAFQWDLYRENTARSGDVELGRWYLVEARGSFAAETSTAEVRIDGVAQPSIASPGQPPSAVKDFVLGSVGTAKTKHVQFDDVRIEVADSPVAFLGP
jgi:hypothetical protein